MSDELWGTDLRLLQNLNWQFDRHRGRDLSVVYKSRTGLSDLETLIGVDNLKQALLMRFLTPVGEMAVLGHPNYGSRLYELIGERNNETTRNRAKMFCLLALSQEPRVAEVLRLDVTPNAVERTQMDIAVSLRIDRQSSPLNFVFPFFLDGAS